jgi:hypothetical protein
MKNKNDKMKNKYNYNYVYRITNKILNKHYYGVRGCNVAPKLDLGIKYFSSSSNKDFRDDQKNHPENYKYKIVRICSNRDEADALEIKLHEKFNVAKSESFYNRAKRTSMGFSTAGTTQTPETRQKMSEAKQNMSDETRQKLSEAAQNMSDETKQKMSEAKTGEKNPMFGKERSAETKQKMSESRKGVPKSDEHRQKLSEAAQNMSDETKQKMSEAKLGVPKGPQEIVQCPHCGKIGGKSLMTRYHFDNCKCKKYN